VATGAVSGSKLVFRVAETTEVDTSSENGGAPVLKGSELTSWCFCGVVNKGSCRMRI